MEEEHEIEWMSRVVNLANEGLPWSEYFQRYTRQTVDGWRETEARRPAADSSDEPYIYTGPRPLLVGGHDQHAVRMDPQTRKCDNASQAGINRGATGQVRNAAGLRRDEFHTIVQ